MKYKGGEIMTGSRPSSPLAHQLVLLALLLGLILGTALPAKGYEVTESWSLRDVVRSIEPGVVWILAEIDNDVWSQGSGFVVHEDGYILTNAHVVADARTITVGWPDRFNRSDKDGELVAIDEELDLALIHINSVHLPALAIDSTDCAGLGDAVITLGYPIGEELGLGGLTVTRGVLSCVRRSEDGSVQMLQTDAAVTLGCSGGPLFDLDTGSVIGIVQGKGMMLLEGFNFAIPSDAIIEFAGSEATEGIPAAIASLGGFYNTDFSVPSARALESYNAAVEARVRRMWSEALSNFLAASRFDEEDPEAAFGVAESYAALDQSSQALEWLERAFELGYSDFDGALDAPGFSDVREDDRFVDLVQSF